MSDTGLAATPPQGLAPPPRPRLARRIRGGVLYGCVLALERAARWIPPLGRPSVGAALGRAACGLLWPLRRQPLRQLEECYGSSLSAVQKRAILRGMFAHLGRSVFELLAMRRVDPAALLSRVQIAGMENFEKARAAGKGFIVVTGHIGNWELLAAWIAARVPLTVLARSLPNAGLNDWIVDLRSRYGVRTVYRGGFSAAREALRALRRGEALGILIDQDTKVDGDFVPFFGKPAFTPTGAAALAERTGSLLLPSFIHREGGEHCLIFEPPVTVEPQGTRARTQHHYTALLTARIENHIRRHPEQWVWVHRRFKTRPPGEEAAK